MKLITLLLLAISLSVNAADSANKVVCKPKYRISIRKPMDKPFKCPVGYVCEVNKHQNGSIIFVEKKETKQ